MTPERIAEIRADLEQKDEAYWGGRLTVTELTNLSNDLLDLADELLLEVERVNGIEPT